MKNEIKILCPARKCGKCRRMIAHAEEAVKNNDLLDGCGINCAQKTILESGISKFEHIHITDFGIVKGKTSFMPDKANEIIEHIKSINYEDCNS